MPYTIEKQSREKTNMIAMMENKKVKWVIRAIAIALVAAFVAQDVAWANPDMGRSVPGQNTLQIPLMTGQRGAGDIKALFEIKLQEIIRSMALPELKERGYKLVVEERGTRFEIKFSTDPEGRLTACCSTLTIPPTSHSFIINDDLSTSLIGGRAEAFPKPESPDMAKAKRVIKAVSPTEIKDSISKPTAADVSGLNVNSSVGGEGAPQNDMSLLNRKILAIEQFADFVDLQDIRDIAIPLLRQMLREGKEPGIKACVKRMLKTMRVRLKVLQPDMRPRSEAEREKIEESLDIIRSVNAPVKLAWVIPMYNEERRLNPKSPYNPFGEDALRKKIAQALTLSNANPLVQIRFCMVDDASTGYSSANSVNKLWRKVRKEYARDGVILPPEMIKVIKLSPEEKKGKKGGAVILGMGDALKDCWADYIGYTDLDISTDLRQSGLLLHPLLTSKAGAAIGSRWVKGAEHRKVPLSGRLSSKIYNWCVQLLIPPLRGINDTQRGFKLFSREAAESILPHAKDRSFAFDTELLLLCRLKGFNIEEVPISWSDSVEASTLSMPIESWSMLRSLFVQRRHMFDARLRKPDAPAAPSHGKPEAAARYSIIDMSAYKQLVISASPVEGTNLEEQTANLLSSIDKVLAENGCGRDSVVKQAVFLKDLSNRTKCEKIFLKHYVRGPPATSYVKQPPINGELIAIEILAVPKKDGINVKTINSNLTIVEQNGTRWAYVAGVRPDSGIKDAYGQALNCLRKMQGLLEANGFKFDQVVRTWIYESKILRKNKGRQRYQLFNDARKVFFETGNGGKPIMFANARPPASTGIGMSGGSFVMECLAIDSKDKNLQILPIENPEQTSAFKYSEKVLETGVSPEKKAPPLFSRGMAIVSGGFQTILISGTASVKGEKPVHVGDVEKQTETTIENIGLVLGQVGATIKDIPQLRVYIKNVGNYEKVKRIVEANFPNIPCLYLLADVCRPEWLVEIEAIAYSAKQSPTPAEPGFLSLANWNTAMGLGPSSSPELARPGLEVNKGAIQESATLVVKTEDKPSAADTEKKVPEDDGVPRNDTSLHAHESPDMAKEKIDLSGASQSDVWCLPKSGESVADIVQEVYKYFRKKQWIIKKLRRKSKLIGSVSCTVTEDRIAKAVNMGIIGPVKKGEDSFRLSARGLEIAELLIKEKEIGTRIKLADQCDELGARIHAKKERKKAAHLLVDLAKCYYGLGDYLNSALCRELCGQINAILKDFGYASKGFLLAGYDYERIGMYDRAAECYERSALNCEDSVEQEGIKNLGLAKRWALAANSYRISGKFDRAGECDKRSAEFNVEIGNIEESMRHYRFAAWNFRTAGRKEDAKECLGKIGELRNRMPTTEAPAVKKAAKEEGASESGPWPGQPLNGPGKFGGVSIDPSPSQAQDTVPMRSESVSDSQTDIFIPTAAEADSAPSIKGVSRNDTSLHAHESPDMAKEKIDLSGASQSNASLNVPDAGIARSYRVWRGFEVAGDIDAVEQRRIGTEKVRLNHVALLLKWTLDQFEILRNYLPSLQNPWENPAKLYGNPLALDYISYEAPGLDTDFLFVIEDGIVKLRVLNPKNGKERGEVELNFIAADSSDKKNFAALLEKLKNGLGLKEIISNASTAPAAPESKPESPDMAKVSVVKRFGIHREKSEGSDGVISIYSLCIHDRAVRLPYWFSEVHMLSNKYSREPIKFRIFECEGLWGICLDRENELIIFNHFSGDRILDDYFVLRLNTGYRDTLLDRQLKDLGMLSERLLYFSSSKDAPIGIGLPVDLSSNITIDTAQVQGLLNAAIGAARIIYLKRKPLDMVGAGSFGAISVEPDLDDPDRRAVIAFELLPEKKNGKIVLIRHKPRARLPDVLGRNFVLEFGPGHTVPDLAEKFINGVELIMNIYGRAPARVTLYSDNIIHKRSGEELSGEPGARQIFFIRSGVICLIESDIVGGFKKWLRISTEKASERFKKKLEAGLKEEITSTPHYSLLMDAQRMVNAMVELHQRRKDPFPMPRRITLIVYNGVPISNGGKRAMPVELAFVRVRGGAYLLDLKRVRMFKADQDLKGIFETAYKIRKKMEYEMADPRAGAANAKPAAQQVAPESPDMAKEKPKLGSVMPDFIEKSTGISEETKQRLAKVTKDLEDLRKEGDRVFAASGFKAKETDPVQFLRNIVDTKELTQNMIEGILSALFSNKKLTLAFSKKLKGLESAQLRALVRQLRKWKESTAQKNNRMKALLDNFTVLEYDDLKVALDEHNIDANARDGLVFTYAPKPKDESENTANIGSAVRPVYIIEEDGGFPANYYYPLLEMVTVSLAKELLQWDEGQLKEALAASNINMDTFGIDTTMDERFGVLIFRVLPKMERYDNDSRIDRYTRLLQFLRSA